jgi:regulator of RNase E activity RraA
LSSRLRIIDPTQDPYILAARFSKFLRVTDVADGLDAVGRPSMTLMDRAIRPLWMGMRFWGPAVTLRVLPTNRPMPIVKREDALHQHGIWHDMGGFRARVEDHVKPGCVVVCSTGGREGVRLLRLQQCAGAGSSRRGRHRHRRLLPRH